MELTQIVTALSAPRSLEEAAAPEGLPEKPGLYAWWIVTPNALEMVPLSPRADGLSLLYIGIAQSGPNSTQTLRSRVLGKHIRGVIGNSTLRRSLAALLWEEQQWQPFWGTDRAQLSKVHNEALHSWMRSHLKVAWLAYPEPWTVEEAVIAAMKSPLNVKDNKSHPFYSTLKAARSRLDGVAGRSQKPVVAGSDPVSLDQLAETAPVITAARIAGFLGIDSKALRKRLRSLRDQGKIADRLGNWSWAMDSPELKVILESYGKTIANFYPGSRR